MQALRVLLECGHNMKAAWKAMEDTGPSHYEGMNYRLEGFLKGGKGGGLGRRWGRMGMGRGRGMGGGGGGG